jgi:hypothetical protein
MAGFMVLAGTAVISLLLHWAQRRPFGRFFHRALVCLIVFAVTGFFSSAFGIIWDGGFPQNEFELMFQDQDGKPLRGVELRVEDRQGNIIYRYPVSDYAPNQIPTSDENGTIVFHHVSNGLEFGGHDWYLFGVIPIRQGAPVYICRFLYENREVYLIEYDELRRGEKNTEQTAAVKRQWKPPDWPFSEMGAKPGESLDDVYERTRSLFNVKSNGKFNREAAIARGAVMREVERQEDAQKDGKEFVEEIEFPVLKKTNTIR